MLIFTKRVQFGVIILLTFSIIACKGSSNIESILKEIDAAPSIASKDLVARRSLARISSSQIHELASKQDMTDSEKLLVVVAYGNGDDSIKGRVIEISHGDGSIATFAAAVLASRKEVTTLPK